MLKRRLLEVTGQDSSCYRQFTLCELLASCNHFDLTGNALVGADAVNCAKERLRKLTDIFSWTCAPSLFYAYTGDVKRYKSCTVRCEPKEFASMECSHL